MRFGQPASRKAPWPWPDRQLILRRGPPRISSRTCPALLSTQPRIPALPAADHSHPAAFLPELSPGGNMPRHYGIPFCRVLAIRSGTQQLPSFVAPALSVRDPRHYHLTIVPDFCYPVLLPFTLAISL